MVQSSSVQCIVVSVDVTTEKHLHWQVELTGLALKHHLGRREQVGWVKYTIVVSFLEALSSISSIYFFKIKT